MQKLIKSGFHVIIYGKSFFFFFFFFNRTENALFKNYNRYTRVTRTGRITNKAVPISFLRKPRRVISTPLQICLGQEQGNEKPTRNLTHWANESHTLNYFQ